MKRYLPTDPPFDEVRQFCSEPMDVWLPSLERIRNRHGLAAGNWIRFGMGRNAVFGLGDQWVVKVMPPQWAGDAKRESAALQLVSGKMPFLAPELVHAGELNGWPYLILERLFGRELYKLWPDLDIDQKASLAQKMGEATARFHDVVLSGDAVEDLVVDWQNWLSEQQARCLDALRDAGLSSQLIDDLPWFLDEIGPLPLPNLPDVFLHGDMNIVNILVREDRGHWHLDGVIDFGDAKVGQVAHDFISPAIHVFRGDARLLKGFYRGYGLTSSDMTEAFQSHLMVRTIFWYAGAYFKKRLDEMALTASCDTWQQVAQRYWHMIE